MADDNLDDFDLDDDDIPSGESGVPAPTDIDDDDDFDFDDDFDYDENGGESKFKKLLEGKKKLIMIGAGALVGLSVIGGGAYWYFMGDDTPEMAEGEAPKGGVGGAVGLALQQTATSGLTPQSKLTAAGAAAGKLTAGGAAVGGKLSAGGAPKLGVQAPAGGMAGGSAGPDGLGGYDPNNTENPLSTAAVADVGINIPAVLPSAVASLGAPIQSQPLAQAVDPALIEQTDSGMLPKVSEDGREPWKTYARPMQGNPATPSVGLVVSGLGMSASLTDAAINHLPADVTLSFSPYGRGINDWVAKARNMGHEVMLELPMESESFPVDDPGPLAMLTSKKPAENLRLLNLVMGQAQGYTGFIGQFGSKFLRDNRALSPVLGELKARGLMFMDPRTAQGSVTLEMADKMQLARAIADTTINTNASEQRIRAQLETIATIAKNQGMTIAVIQATPNSLKTIKNWAAGLQGVQIAPMSSLAGRQQS